MTAKLASRMMLMLLKAAALMALIPIRCASSFSLGVGNHNRNAKQCMTLSMTTRTARTTARLEPSPDDDENNTPSPLQCRRQMLLSSLAATTAGFLTLSTSPQPAAAAEDGKTVYLSGKAPIVPGQKPRDKNDTTGTRKDPNFLRSISDCKSQCENKPGPDGLYKSKEDCLSECQDICCTTYEQCTFAIVPRI